MSMSKKSVSRRDFGKKVAIGVVGVAAAAALPAGKACAFGYNADGTTFTWACRDVWIEEEFGSHAYQWIECFTGNFFIRWENSNGLPPGDCDFPRRGACMHMHAFQKDRIVLAEGQEVHIAPDVSWSDQKVRDATKKLLSTKRD